MSTRGDELLVQIAQEEPRLVDDAHAHASKRRISGKLLTKRRIEEFIEEITGDASMPSSVGDAAP